MTTVDDLQPAAPAYLIRASSDGLDTWSAKRLPFEPSGWMRQWRDELAGAFLDNCIRARVESARR
jgi:hypothetical protein